jgi:hypothetical protein
MTGQHALKVNSSKRPLSDGCELFGATIPQPCFSSARATIRNHRATSIKPTRNHSATIRNHGGRNLRNQSLEDWFAVADLGGLIQAPQNTPLNQT